MILNLILSLALCLLTSGFCIFRSYITQATCTPLILLYSELLKGFVSALFVIRSGDIRICSNVKPIVPPAVCFIVQNMVSFWTITQVPASVYVMFMQLKLLWTMLCSRIILHKSINTVQMICALFITISCVNIVQKNNFHKHINTLAVIGLLVETLLSALSSIYIQRMFDSSTHLMWLRNVELSLLSLPIYIGLMWNDSCSVFPTNLEVYFAVLAAMNGILVALVLTHCGATEKTLITSCAIVLTACVEHFIYQKLPSLNNASFYAICALSVFLFVHGTRHPTISKEESSSLLPTQVPE